MFQQIQKVLSNLPGWHTRRKLVVIESDDWGSIRMPSLDVFTSLKTAGVNISSGDNLRFNTLDTLASQADLELLFSTLRKFKDHKGNHPVITAMSLCTNPDFEKIKASNFEHYFFEPVTATLARYGRTGALEMWKQGEEERLFFPEFHGREHLNVKVWMDDLRSGMPDTLAAFEKNFWGFRAKNKTGISYQAAFDLDLVSSINEHKQIIDTGLALFEKIHGRKARYFVPPNGAIHQEVVDHSIHQGIHFVSTSKIHNEPQGSGKIKKRYRYLGMKGEDGMRYVTRNCFFEPSYKGNGFGIGDCLSHIHTAFTFNKPAVISTHRVNFVGGLQEANRSEGNKALNELLHAILKKWPAVEFLTSTQLGQMINNDKK